MSAEPENNDQPPKAVSAAQWLKKMGLGVPPLGSVVSCADCMKQVEVKDETWVLPRPKHSDAVVLCDVCSVPHHPPYAASDAAPSGADLWSSAAPPAGSEPGEKPNSEPALPTSLGEDAQAPEANARAPGAAPQPIGTETTLQGIIPFDADMQGSLRISSAEDVSRILQRLHQVVVAAEFLKSTPDGQPTALLTDALDFITGRDDHCVLVLQAWEAGRPAVAEERPADAGAVERVEDNPS